MDGITSITTGSGKETSPYAPGPQGRDAVLVRGSSALRRAGVHLKRGAPLKRYTPLRSSSRLEVRTGLKRGKPIARSWMKPSARGTKHSRRERHLGYLLFCKYRACEARLLFGVDPCRYDEDGLSEAAHLGERKGYRADDLDSSSLCGWHHRDNGIDQSKGPFLGWTREQKLEFKIAAIARAQAEWFALTLAQREDWNARAAGAKRRRAA